MTPEQENLLIQARESLSAALLLHEKGFFGFAAARAYYTMFYVAQAILLERGLAFSKHSGVHSAFGEHFVKTGIIAPEFHRYLIRGMEVRHTGDYTTGKPVNPTESQEQISRAEKFLQLGENTLTTQNSDTP